MTAAASPPPLVLVTGVTGYIGGRLAPVLLGADYRVRAMARHPERLRDRPWFDDVEVIEADASDPDQLRTALDGVDVAYYLIHALGSGDRFEALDRHTAREFGVAARTMGVGRIVYLGGLYPDHERLSPHLESRKEVGEILLASGVPTTVLRAAVIIGSGSASFEMLRYLTERLPVMITPKWLNNRIQPIAVRDVLHYLLGSASMPAEVNRGFDIGGPDVLTYREMMQAYARAAGLSPRRIRTVPLLTPSLSSHWVGVVTPVPSDLAKPLVGSLIHEVVCKEHDIAAYVPDPDDGLTSLVRALALALQRIKDLDVVTSWSSAATPGAPSDPLPGDPDWAGGALFRDEREIEVVADREALWRVIESIGGDNGWYSWPLAWWARGTLDRLVGGPGLRRGRRHPTDLSVGDPLDWWRVEQIEDQHLLRLRAEMRLPGLAWLELIVESKDATDTGARDAGPHAEDGPPRTVFQQRALFHPQGLAGYLYWVAMLPFHGMVFGGMQRNIAAVAESAASAGSAAPARAPSQPTTGAEPAVPQTQQVAAERA